jgi:hypothetical protein
MKIAYLVLAHNQPDQFKRLIARLTTEDAHFFVHIDKKVDISQFVFETQRDNVHFLEDRTWINHSGFSGAWAAVKLMATAFYFGVQSGVKFDYFITMSGQDYPIKTNAEITAFLEARRGENCMNFYPLVEGAAQIENIQRRYYWDTIGNTGWPSWIQRCLRGAATVVEAMLPERVFVEGLVPYRGSAWMCLNWDTVQYVCQFMYTPKGRQLRRFFKHVKAADEMFVHTIVMNSRFAAQCRFFARDINKGLKNENKAYCHYVDWSPERDDPAILNIFDFMRLMNSEFLFARKFETVRSAELLALIDSILLNWHASASR